MLKIKNGVLLLFEFILEPGKLNFSRPLEKPPHPFSRTSGTPDEGVSTFA